jgi:hypothetical protein
VKSLKGSYRTRPRSNPVNVLAAMLFGPLLAHGAARAAEAALSDTWSKQKIEAAFHDVLAHGDLSDIGFLASTLGLNLEVDQWERASSMQKESIETRAMAKEVPSYLRAYGTSYVLTTNNKDGTTQIYFGLAIKSCPDLSSWGNEWNQQVQTSHGISTDDGPAYSTESIRWQEDAEGILLESTEDSNGSCLFTLQQNKHAALSVPEPPATTPGPGTELLEQMIDLVAAADLRDYLTTARILHVEMSTYGKLRGNRLYDGGATPEQVIPGTNTRFFMYFANDTGWIDAGAPIFMHRRGPRSATLWISVDRVANCISPESLETRMRQKHIHFQKKADPTFGPYLQTFQRGNAFSIGYYLEGSCIEELKLEQKTDFLHGLP